MIDRTTLLGEVVSWLTRGCGRVTVHGVRSALIDAGLPVEAALDLAPKNAFRRAITQLRKERVIKQLPQEEADKVRFQLNRQILLANEFHFPREAAVELDMTTGDITCDDSEIQELARKLYADALATRTANDITRLLGKLFERRADIYSINAEKGGSYFVPAEHLQFVDQVDKFLKSLGGQLRRFPVPKGDQRGNESVAQSIRDGLEQHVRELQAAVEGWDESTKGQTMERQAERFKVARHKVESLAVYLGDQVQGLLEQVQAANDGMRRKIESLAAEKEAAEAAAS